ncbi:MAG: glycoside hydrolase family 30 protein [Planctomycetaceae bacterium]
MPMLSLTALTAARAADGVQVVVTTADGVRRLDAEADLPLMPLHDGPGPVITIDRGVRGQSILGMGASFDHASCENLARLSPERRAEVIEMLFHPRRGLGMNLMRVCIGTSDFTGVPYYTYDDMPEGRTDPDLAAFSIAADREHVIPAIRAAREVNPDLLLYASPWSPPAWMKKPERLGGGSVEPRWYPAYARYLLAFLRAYEAEGLPIHALTVQNEPHMTHRGYPTTAWTAAAQRDFIRDHLGPLFEREGVTTLIWCWDHNWNEPEFPRAILADPAAARFVDGTAFHHYEGDVAAQGRLHDEFPAKHLYFTEGSTFGIRGAETIVSILRNWSRSYNFWVFLLDEHQRPNRGPHDATPTCLELLDDGSVRTNLDFFVYAQFMRHIPRGAVRVASTVPAGGTANVAFEDAAGRIVHVIVNPTRQRQPIHVACGRWMVSAALPPESVVTHVWPAAE